MHRFRTALALALPLTMAAADPGRLAAAQPTGSATSFQSRASEDSLLAKPTAGTAALRPALTLGRVWQDSPITNESGFAGAVTLSVPVVRRILLKPGVEFARTHVNSGVSLCIRLESGDCLKRPHDESLLTLGALIGLQLTGGAIVRPHLDAGAALSRSLSSANPGERRSFLAPQLAAGLWIQTGIGAWDLSARWRRLDRWTSSSGEHQVAVLLSWQPGKAR